ncbi:MAG: hypothetical protein WB611_21165 [Stellaceae bacterium]
MKIGKALSLFVLAAMLLGGLSGAAKAQPQNDAAIAVGQKGYWRCRLQPARPRDWGLGYRRDPELPTRFRRIVVTDDNGRYLVPDLPQADYSVWVRGAMVLWTRQRCARSRASGSTLQRHRRRVLQMQRIITRRSIGIRC